MDRIGVFCSSSEVLSESVIQATQELGAWIGSHKKMLVYGGVNKGLMEVIAYAVKQHGGRVMGILPQAFACPERQSQYVDTEVPVSHLCDRKATLMRESDVFIVLPGGIGTLDEMFCVLAARQVGEHHKPVMLFNPDGCWNPLIQALQILEDQHYIRSGYTRSIVCIDRIDEAIHWLEQQDQ